MTPEKVNKVAELLENAGVDPDDIGTIDKVRVGSYQMLTKERQEDGTDETKVHDLEVANVVYTPRREATELDFVRQAPPTIIRSRARSKPARADMTTLVIPDMQIGFRGTETFHDERAMRLAQVAVRELQPDRVIFIGDNLDLAPLSKYEQRPDWQRTTQASIDAFHKYLAQTRANAPDANIVVLEGNHCIRLERSIRKFNSEIAGLRQAESELGVLTLRFLLRTDELGINYITGYPNGQYWIEDNLKATHGTIVKSGGSTAAAVVAKEDTSTIFGHIHRPEIQYRTIATRYGARTIMAATFGTLARIDGGVPSNGYTTDEYNQTVLRAENWAQAVGLITHNPRVHQAYPLMITDEGIHIFEKRFQ